MLLLPRNNNNDDPVQINTSPFCDDAFVQNKNISLKIMNDIIEMKVSYFFKNVDKNIVSKETYNKNKKNKRKIDSLNSLLTTSRKISNKIQRIDVSCTPIIKKKKCVQFDLSTTTVHDLGRIYFSGAYSTTTSPINNETAVQLEEMIVDTSSLKIKANDDDQPNNDKRINVV